MRTSFSALTSLLVILSFSLLLANVNAGGKMPRYGGASPLPMKTLPPKFEQLPDETLPPKYLDTVVKKTYIDQEIIQPKEITQPIIQQRLVEQPIIRTRLVHQPLIRRVVHQHIVRPHVVSKEHVTPLYQTQDVLVPKYIEKNVVKEEFEKQHQRSAPSVEAPTFSGKSRSQLYGDSSYNPPSLNENENNGLGYASMSDQMKMNENAMDVGELNENMQG